MQKVTNIRGWLKSINDHRQVAEANEEGLVELGTGDLFGFQINYDTPNNATALFNGNISETYWKTATDNMVRNYGYAYDQLNRLLHAQFYKEDGSDDGAYNESLSYDKNGNITNLERWGKIYADAHRIDQLNYTYTGNQLRAVADETNSPQGFLDGNTSGNDYSYDANGNMISDANKGIIEIVYNHLNLPKLITFVGGQSISYLYNALGQKIQKQVSNGLQSSITEYLSGFQYRQASMGRRISPSVPRLVFFPTAEGYFNVVSASPLGELVGAYVYNYTDHLGNIRLSYTFDEQINMLKIMEENHYYPFGLKHQNYNSEMLDYTLEDNEVALQTFANQIGDGKYNYKYNGKEFQEELGLNVTAMDYRQYDGAIGRFNSIDLLADATPWMNPYRFGFNNPVLWKDPSGLQEVDPEPPAWNNVLPEIVVYGKAKQKEDTPTNFNYALLGNDRGYTRIPLEDYNKRYNTNYSSFDDWYYKTKYMPAVKQMAEGRAEVGRQILPVIFLVAGGVVAAPYLLSVAASTEAAAISVASNPMVQTAVANSTIHAGLQYSMTGQVDTFDAVVAGIPGNNYIQAAKPLAMGLTDVYFDGSNISFSTLFFGKDATNTGRDVFTGYVGFMFFNAATPKNMLQSYNQVPLNGFANTSDIFLNMCLKKGGLE